jgi:two-component system sensor histidine kinase EvgS
VTDRPTRGPDAAEAVLDPAVVDSLRQLGERSGRDVLGDLTGLFLSTADAQVGVANELLDRADLPELARIAHSLKGSGGVIGARRLSAAAAALEQTCGRPDRSVAGGSVAESRAALARFVDELEVFRCAVAALDPTR